MSRVRILVDADAIRGATARPGADALHHLVDVLRLTPGAEVEVFDGRGSCWDATWVGEELRLGARRDAPRPGAVVWLAFALAKGEKVDLVVQKATELGAARLIPFRAERSVMRLEGDKAEERARRWRRIAAEASRQCGRADVPEVLAPVELSRALEAPAGFALLAFHGGGAPLSAVLPPGAPGFLALTGPEGGFTNREIGECLAAGCKLASLGPRVLRAETAALVVAALIQHRSGDLR